jgi:predicted transcriptional regulator
MKQTIEDEILQQITRKKLNEYIRENGVKANFVSEKCGIDASSLSQFRNGRKVLWKDDFRNLMKFLRNHNVKQDYLFVRIEHDNL